MYNLGRDAQVSQGPAHRKNGHGGHQSHKSKDDGIGFQRNQGSGKDPRLRSNQRPYGKQRGSLSRKGEHQPKKENKAVDDEKPIKNPLNRKPCEEGEE